MKCWRVDACLDCQMAGIDEDLGAIFKQSAEIERIAGVRASDAGMNTTGPRRRDLGWLLGTEAEAKALKNRLDRAEIKGLSVRYSSRDG